MLGILIFCFAYQAYYFFLLYLKKEKKYDKEVKPHRFAVLVAARNEEAVIGQLLESIHMQEYPKGFVDTYIVADNCEDDTAEVARRNGAVVYERFNKVQVGKGYALEFLMDRMKEEGSLERYDGYFIFDADNLLEKNYIQEMNRTFCQGYRIITSYRNTKNFGRNWLTSGYGLWFLHEAQWLNKARMLNGTSCAVSGTGFFFSREILQKMGGWKYFLLTEDIEFTISQILDGEKIGYCKNAVFYDEQPENFVSSWHQRARWVKGYQQVFQKYGRQICRGVFKEKKFACFDMTMSIWPAFVIVIISFLMNAGLLLGGLLADQDVSFVLYNAGLNLIKTYGMMALLGGYTLITEWKRIRAGVWFKIGSVFTFPIFMFTFAPIAIVALTRKVEWKPIEHRCTLRLSQLTSK